MFLLNGYVIIDHIKPMILNANRIIAKNAADENAHVKAIDLASPSQRIIAHIEPTTEMKMRNFSIAFMTRIIPNATGEKYSKHFFTFFNFHG